MRQKGFTLVEVLITLFVVAMLGVASRSLVVGDSSVRLAKDQNVALKIAGNEIESLRAGGYAALPVSGPFSDSLLSTLPSGAGAMAVSAYNAKTAQIVVTISWQEGVNAESLSLSTLVTQTGGLP